MTDKSMSSILTDKGMLLQANDGLLDSDRPLEFDLTVIGRQEDEVERRVLSRRAVDSIMRMTTLSQDCHRKTDNLGAVMSVGTIGDGVRFGMHAQVALPDVGDVEASQYVTEAMRRTARQVRLFDADSQIDDMVYAVVSRESGIELQTNPAGSCAIYTDGHSYGFERARGERVKLYQHNLYTNTMQLVCLSGLIALSNLRKATQSMSSAQTKNTT